MIKTLKIGIMAMAIFGWSCGASGRSSYKKDMLREANRVDNILNIAVMTETAYFLAGADILSQSENEVILKLVRCRLKKSCDVDIKAVYNRETGYHELDVTQEKVSFDFGKDGLIEVTASG